MKTGTLLILGIVLALAGCANPFVKFYHPNQYYDPSMREGVPAAEPQVYSGNNVNQDIKQLDERGYMEIGYSSFNGPSNRVGPRQAVDEAKTLGADIVLVYSKYTNTVSGTLPFTTPHVETSTTNMYGNINGTGGSANITGSATTITYGSQTTYIPYSVNRSDFLAVYFVKTKTRLGVSYLNLSDEQRQALGSNSGVYVTTVVDDSPAFTANVLPGDIILKINDQPATDIYTFGEELRELGGQQVTLTIWRNGTTIQKTVTLNH